VVDNTHAELVLVESITATIINTGVPVRSKHSDLNLVDLNTDPKQPISKVKNLLSGLKITISLIYFISFDTIELKC